MVVFFFGFRRCNAGVSNGISDASVGRDNRTAVNRSSRIFCRPANRDSILSKSRQPNNTKQKYPKKEDVYKQTIKKIDTYMIKS